MTTLHQYARPEWAAPRKETWYEHLLPQRVTDTINQSPLVGALSKYMNSPPPDLTLPSERDSKVPMPRSPSWFDDRPVATEALDKFGLLANFIGPGAKLPPPAPKPQGIRAYHGSPHDFDKFDINKIGTGEGAQAYGRGLYFAEAEAVAKNYRDQLGNYDDVVRWKGSQPPTPDQQRIIDQLSGFDVARNQAADVASVRADITKAINRERMSEGMPGWDAKDSARRIAELRRQLETIDGMKDMIDLRPPGRMYEVKINADPEQFLDWDKPLSQQPEGVRKALNKVGGAAESGVNWADRRGGRIEALATDGRTIGVVMPSGGQWVARRNFNESRPGGDDIFRTAPTREAAQKLLLDWYAPNTPELTGEYVYRSIVERPRAVRRTGDPLGDAALPATDHIAASQALREAGIPGIKYLDQGSRAAGQGSRNYVVFDDALITILRKYGLLPPAAVGAMAAANGGEDGGLAP